MEGWGRVTALAPRGAHFTAMIIRDERTMTLRSAAEGTRYPSSREVAGAHMTVGRERKVGLGAARLHLER